MPALTFVVPIVPGKEEADRRWFQEMAGPRWDASRRSRQRLGVQREVVWHQRTPQGTVAIVYMEVDDPQRMFEGVGPSDDPFDHWFRQRAQDVHGIDLSQPFPGGLPELVFDGPMP